MRPLRARRSTSPHSSLSPSIKIYIVRCFSTFLHLFFTSSCRSLASSCIVRVCAPILLSSWFLSIIVDSCVWTFGWGIVFVTFLLEITSLQLSQFIYFVLRLKLVIQTFYLIRRLVYSSLPCKSTRDDSFLGHTRLSLRSTLSL